MKPLIALIMFLPLLSHAQDFRGHTWGDGMETVLAREGEPIGRSGDTFVYRLTLQGLETGLLLNFLDGQLSSAAYVFTEPHTNNNAYLSDFEMFESLLEQNYGEPENEIEDWSNDLYRNDPEDYGMALAAGHLGYMTSWETDSTIVHHQMTGDNFEIAHAIRYESKALAEAVDQRDRQQILDQL